MWQGITLCPGWPCYGYLPHARSRSFCLYVTAHVGSAPWSRLILTHRSNDSLKLRCREVEKTECSIGFHLRGQYVTGSLFDRCSGVANDTTPLNLLGTSLFLHIHTHTSTHKLFLWCGFWLTACCRLICQLTVHINPLSLFTQHMGFRLSLYLYLHTFIGTQIEKKFLRNVITWRHITEYRCI